MTGLSSDEVRSRLVQPFYLAMMNTNALDPSGYSGDLIHDVRSAGLAATPEQVIGLLRLGWREQVMGAWLALRHAEPPVADAVLKALESSSGYLTSPPLATVAVTLVGTSALPSIDRYARQDLANGWGGARMALAAAEHVAPGYTSAHALPAPSEEDRTEFAALLDVARRVQAA